MSRRWKSRKGFALIRLFIVDDLHMLGESGSVQEVIVSRMRMVAAQTERQIRFFGLGLSIADYKEVGEWLGVNPSLCFNFSPTARPCPVQILIQSFDNTHRPTRIGQMVKHIYPQLKQFQKELSIIYVSDRKQARLTALDLMALSHAD